MHRFSDEQSKQLFNRKKYRLASGAALVSLYCGAKHAKDRLKTTKFDEQQVCDEASYFPPKGQEHSYKDRVSTIIVKTDA